MRHWMLLAEPADRVALAHWAFLQTTRQTIPPDLNLTLIFADLAVVVAWHYRISLCLKLRDFLVHHNLFTMDLLKNGCLLAYVLR